MGSFVPIDGLSQVWIRETARHQDRRGFFSEEFRNSECPVAGLEFIQDSLSYSKKDVLRGLHLQVGQWQLITLVKGKILDVLIDMSPESQTYTKSLSIELSDDGLNQLLVRPGVAHGYGVLSEEVIIHYKSSVYYGQTPQFGLLWSSQDLVAHWPKREWVVSDRDANFPVAQDLLTDSVFKESFK